MESTPKHLVLVAGEASGDMHAAHLVEAIKHINPSITFSGLGGPKMKAAGVELYQDLTEMAVVGFWEVVKQYYGPVSTPEGEAELILAVQDQRASLFVNGNSSF